MAPKLSQKCAPLEENPSASSSSFSEEENDPSDNEQEETHTQEIPKVTPEESESESDDEDESDDEESEQQPSAEKLTSTTTTVTRNPQPNSPSSGSDSETHSAQLTSPSVSAFTIKPITSKPVDKKPSASKRPVTTENGEKSGGKAKKAKVEPEEEKKSGGGVNRLWREDDEAVLLRGMAEFQSKKGVDPYSAMGEFHEFVKKSLSVEVSRSQVMDKVKRMKKKYENNAGKGENGSDSVFSKPHEHRCFELSKNVWGRAKENANGVVEENGDVGNSSSKRARKTVKLEEKGKGVVVLKEEVKGEVKVEDGKLEDFWSAYPCFKQSVKKEPVESFMVEGMRVVQKAKAKELERKWKNLAIEEVALYIRKLDLVRETTRLVLDAMRASSE